MINETQWSTESGAVNVHGSELDGCHVGLSFIGNGTIFSADMTVCDAMKLRDSLSSAITDTFRDDKSIQCPACGYTWGDANVHRDHRQCRQYPFFPDERGSSHAVNR